MAARRKRVMTRAYRVFLGDANKGKLETLANFVVKCRDITEYFVDLYKRNVFSRTRRLGKPQTREMSAPI
jgi:hypothetical protein